jgi:hypothetical protein
MTFITPLSGMVVLSLCTAAAADFTGLTCSFSDDGTFRVVQVYANFDDGSDITLSVYNANTAQSGFNQSDGGGGMWLPFFSTIGGDTSIDSYVNLNAVDNSPSGTFGTVNLDPNFGSGMGDFIPENAGWYQSPTQPAVQGTMVHLGQFVLADGAWFDISLYVGWKREGTTETFGSYGECLPAPGALALLGLGGLVGRRRRA